MNRLLLIASFCCLPLLTGCFLLNHDVRSAKPILADANLQRPFQVSQHFEDHDYSYYLFWALLPISRHDTQRLIDPIANAGDGIINLEIREKSNFGTTLLNILTAGIVTGRVVHVEGDVFVYKP